MSAENVELVVRQFENTSARDFEAVMDAYADDVVVAVYGAPYVVGEKEGTVATGKQAVGEWFGDWFRTFDRDYWFEIEETRDWGERVFIVATHHGRGRVSGAPVAHRAAWIYTVRDGKIVRCDAYADAASALEAVGESE